MPKTMPFMGRPIRVMTLAAVMAGAVTLPAPRIYADEVPTISDPSLINFSLETATIDDVQQAMANKALTSVELVTLYMNRISTYDQGGASGVVFNSVPALNPKALEEAAEADRLRAEGTVLGPLHGIPFVSKGNYAVKGRPLTNGLTAWVDMVATRDAFIIATMRQAGAIFLGHANQDAFQSSASSSTSQNWGTVRNAYVVGFSAGGSSGGPGTATGANFASFALGGETGGSVRGPADRAGAFGFKGSNGVISVDGLAPLAWDRDVVGPMTRYAKDMAYVMDVANAYNPNDIWSSIELAPGRARPSDFVKKLSAGKNSLAGKKIGVLTTYTTPTATGIGAEINAAFAQARLDLEALGATVVEVTLPSYVNLESSPRRASIPPEVEVPPQRRLYSPTNSDLTGAMVSAAKAYPHEKLMESLFVSPTDSPAFRLAKIMFWIDPVTQIDANMKTAIRDRTTFGPTDPRAVEHFQAVRYMIADYENWLNSEGIDVLIFPTATNKTASGNTSPGRATINSHSLPFLTVPMGVLSTGEPTTFGVMGRYFADADVLAIAGAYENATRKRIVSTLAPALTGESFSYRLLPPPAGPTNEGVPVTPIASINGVPSVVGRGKQAKMNLGGVALTAAPLDSISLTINGIRYPVTVENGTWAADIPLARLKTFAARGQRVVTVVVLVKDINGNSYADRRAVRLPLAAIKNS